MINRVDLKGEIFIIPNDVTVYGAKGIQEGVGYNVVPASKNFAFFQVCTSVWMTSEECDNWATEQHPLLRENERISDIFPVELLLGKREGDLLEIHLKRSHRNIVLSLVCKQRGNRYGSKDFKPWNFEEALTHCFKKRVIATETGLSEDDQNALFQESEEKFKLSLEKEPSRASELQKISRTLYEQQQKKRKMSVTVETEEEQQV